MTIERSSTHQERARTASDLDRLIDLESRLQDFLARARTHAGERVEAAQKEAGAIEERLGAELIAQERDLEAKIEREIATRIEALETQARNHAQRFEGVSEATIQELAETIVERLARGGAG